MGRLQTQGHDFAGTAGDQSVTLGYNPVGQITSEARSNDAYRWTGAANVSRDYQVNGLNQYRQVGPNTYGYDLNGNLTSDGSSTFVYDAENRLVSASGAKTAALSYDPNGRLWQVTSPAGTRRFLYDGDRLISEYDASGAIIGNYTHGPGSDEPLLSWETSNNYATRYFHADHQGSIVAAADDAGNPVQINGYDPWGIPNAANHGRFGYTGQAWVPELGMWYYKARIYSPTLGRFLQTDPIGYKDQVNLYAYVANDPVDNVDPAGTTCAPAGGGRFKCQFDYVEENHKVRPAGPHDHHANADFERSYTRYVNKVTSHPEKRIGVVVPGNGPVKERSFSISAGEVGQALIHRRFVAAPGVTNQGNAAMATTNNTTYVFAAGLHPGWTKLGGPETTRQVGVGHEGIHDTPSEKSMAITPFLATTYRDAHQEPYNDAARALMEPPK